MNGGWRDPQRSAKTRCVGGLHRGDAGILDSLHLRNPHHERRHQRASRIHPRGVGEALPHQATAISDLSEGFVARAALDLLRAPTSRRIKRLKHSFFVGALPKNLDGKAFETILCRQARTTKGRNA
jgi:hypothetical protein